MDQEMNGKAYPCDEPEERKSYPCDEEQTFFDAREANTLMDSNADGTAEAAPVRKGKGRRGGNAAASVVVHSGKFKQPRRESDGAILF